MSNKTFEDFRKSFNFDSLEYDLTRCNCSGVRLAISDINSSLN